MERYKLAAMRVSETGMSEGRRGYCEETMSFGHPKMLTGFETTLSWNVVLRLREVSVSFTFMLLNLFVEFLPKFTLFRKAFIIQRPFRRKRTDE